MRQGHVLDLGPRLPQPVHCFPADQGHLGIELVGEVLARDPDPKPLDARLLVPNPVRNVEGRRGRVPGVVPRDGVEEERRVLHGRAERPNLIEGRSERDEAVSAHPPVGGLDPDDTAERRGLSDRAPRVGSEGAGHDPCRHRSRRSPRAPPRDPGPIAWISRGAEAGVLRRGAHRELVHVRLSENDRARAAKTPDNGRLERRDVSLQNPGATRGRQLHGAEVVLHGHGHAGEGTRARALAGVAAGTRAAGADLARRRRTALGTQGEERMHGIGSGLDLSGPSECLPDVMIGGDPPGPNRLGHLPGIRSRAHRGTSLRRSPVRRCGSHLMPRPPPRCRESRLTPRRPPFPRPRPRRGPEDGAR